MRRFVAGSKLFNGIRMARPGYAPRANQSSGYEGLEGGPYGLIETRFGDRPLRLGFVYRRGELVII